MSQASRKRVATLDGFDTKVREGAGQGEGRAHLPVLHTESHRSARLIDHTPPLLASYHQNKTVTQLADGTWEIFESSAAGLQVRI
jgi:hypothetical protein